MKNLPDKIYLNLGPGVPEDADFRYLQEVTWSDSKVSDSDIEYVRAPQWISVEDRVPEDREVVLVRVPPHKVLHDYTLPELVTIACVADGVWRSIMDCRVHPTHWMQLPKIPETK